MKKFILWLIKIFNVSLPKEIETVTKIEVMQIPAEIKDGTVDGDLIIKGKVIINGSLICKGEIAAYKS